MGDQTEVWSFFHHSQITIQPTTNIVVKQFAFLWILFLEEFSIFTHKGMDKGFLNGR